MIAKIFIIAKPFRIERITYIRTNVFVIMAMRRAARWDPTSRKRTNAPRVPLAKRPCLLAAKTPRAGYVPCVRKIFGRGFTSWDRGEAF